MVAASCTTPSALTSDQLAQFAEFGYLTLPGFLDPELTADLKREVDDWAAGGAAVDRYAAPSTPSTEPPARLQLELPEHGRLISHPPLMAMLEQIMGAGFAYHHLHTARHDAGSRGVDWHHDYEQYPQSNRSHVMVHVFYYLNGLDGTIGDLLVLPGSHRVVLDRSAFSQFGTADLPGSVVIDRLSPGSAVIVHSALPHARRAKPGGEDHPRYFIDASYCQRGVKWPSAYNHWRHMLARARELGLDRGNRYGHLFDPDHFFDSVALAKRLREIDQGSLGYRLLGDPA